jgi:RNase P/RNase MRP subunit POP5
VKGNMPVKKYKTRYIVIEIKGPPYESHEKLNNIMRNIRGEEPDFHFKIVREYDGVIIVKCPHKAVPIFRTALKNLVNTQGIKILGISGTLRKAVKKFVKGGLEGQRL